MVEQNDKGNLSQLYYQSNAKDFQLLSFGYSDYKIYGPPLKHFYIKDRFALHYVFSGEGMLFIEDKVFEIKPKTFFLAPMNKRVYYYPKEDNPWEYAWFSYIGENAPILNQKLGFTDDCPVRETPTDFDQSVLNDMLLNLRKTGKLTLFYSLSSFYKLCDMLSNEKRDYAPTEKLVNNAKRIIETNYTDNNFSVTSIAKLLFVSYSHLAKVFRQQVGITLVNYLWEKRLKKAGELLKNTDLTAKEIAYTVGYNDHVHFLKSFKSFYGKTTKAFREYYKKSKKED